MTYRKEIVKEAIFPRVRFTCDMPATEEQVREAIEAACAYDEQRTSPWSPEINIEKQLAKCESRALAVWDAYNQAIRDKVRGKKLQTIHWAWKDSLEVVARVQQLRQLLEDGDRRAIAWTAMCLGESITKMDARWAEPAVKRVKETTKALRDSAPGHSASAIDAALACYDDLLKKYPNHRKTALKRTVRIETGIPQRTLEYHLQKRLSAAAKARK